MYFPKSIHKLYLEETPIHGHDFFITKQLNLSFNITGEIKDNMVFCSDLLDALTQDFFARKGNTIEEPLHVEEIKVIIVYWYESRLKYESIFRYKHLLIDQDTRERPPVCGNREKNTALHWFKQLGEITTSNHYQWFH